MLTGKALFNTLLTELNIKVTEALICTKACCITLKLFHFSRSGRNISVI